MARTGLLLDDLRIQGFRGLASPIRLDLGVPLTVIYAPNGTGKTTICDSVEWLLTNGVERLRGSLSAILPKFSINIETEIKASARIEGESIEIGRWKDSQGEIVAGIGAEGSDLKILGQTDFLKRLFPKVQPDRVHHIRLISDLSTWIRGTMFLSDEALSRLIDHTQEKAREDIFSDLLGIRHLLNMEESLQRYLSPLDLEVPRVQSDLSRLEDELEEIRAETAEAAGQDTVLEDALTAAFGALGLKKPHDPQETPYSTLRKDFEAERARYEDALVAFRTAYVTAETNLDEIVSVAKSVEEERTKRRNITAQGKEARADAGKAHHALEELTRQILEIEASLGELEQRASSFVAQASRVREAATALAGSEGEKVLTVPIATIPDFLPLAAWPEAALVERIELIDRLHADWNGIASDRERLKALGQEIAEIEAADPTDNQMGILENQLSEAKRALAEIRKEIDDQSDALTQLRALGVDVVEGLTDETHCPLCGHDWDDHNRLHKAVHRAVEVMSPAFATMRAESARRENHVRELEEGMRVVKDQRRTLAEKRKLRQSLESKLNEYELQLQEVGLDRSQMKQAEALTTLRLHLDFAYATVRLLSTAPITTHDAAATFLVAVTPRDLPEEAPRWIDAVREHMVATREALAKFAADLSAAEEKASARVRKLTNEIQRIDQRLKETTPKLTAFSEAWSKLDVGEAWTDEGLKRARANLRNREKRFEEAVNWIYAVDAVREAEQRTTEIKKKEQEHGRLQRQLSRINNEASDKRTLLERLRNFRKLEEQQRMGALQDVVAVIFARLHGNEVFDGLRLIDSVNFEAVFRGIGYDSLEPLALSHGQRQDLAIAIFLARARTIGGTFFIDDAVAHLDDLNRVGFLDVFRALALSSGDVIRLVLTTASRRLANQLIAKFELLDRAAQANNGRRPIRIYKLDGNPRVGVEKRVVFGPPEGAL